MAVMNPVVILISNNDDGDYERNTNEELDVVLISDDDNGDELVVNDVEKADEEVRFDNCNYVVDCLHQGNNHLPKLSLKECKLYLRKYGMRLSGGTKEDYIQRMKEHVRLIDRRGVSLYPRSSFSINCTGDVCKGDIVMFKQNIYTSQRKTVGRRTVAGRIVKESYSKSNQQHTFSVEVLWSEPSKKLNPLSILLVKGCNLYKFGTFRQPWTCEAERSKVLGEKHSRGNAARHKRKLKSKVLGEKHSRGNAARHKRKLKQIEFASNNNKGVKRQKVSYKGPFLSKLPTQIDKTNPRRQCADSVEESTSTNAKKAVTVRFQKTKLKRLKDRRVNLLYPRSSFSINCTGDACKGDVVLFKQKQSNKRGERVGKLINVTGKIVKESYGAFRQQHTFTIEVLWTKHSMNPLSLSTLLVRGCNLYRFGTFRQPWKNEAERLEVLEEKHERGEAARHKRKLRLAQIASTNDKGRKGQKESYRGSSRSKLTTRLVKLKFSKRWSAALAMPQKRKSTQLSHHPNSNPSLSKQPTQTDKKKFSKRQGSSLVKKSKAAHKRKAVQVQRTEFNRSTQPTFHQEPNPNRSMNSDHNLQEASLSFPYYPNLNPNRFMYSDHHLQEASSFFPYDPNLSLWSLGNNGQWGPSNVFYQPPGQYRYSYEQPGYYLYNYEQPGYYLYNYEQPVPIYWFG